MSILFHNCRVLRDDKLVRDELWIKDGKMVDSMEGRSSSNFQIINCNDRIIAPGFIDIQINGAYGQDFTSHQGDTPVYNVATKLPRTGCTSFCPTVITSQPNVYRQRIQQIKYRPGNAVNGATVLGVHLEGPFISLEKRGCHPPELVQALSEGCQQIEETYGHDLGDVVMVTLAPEHPSAMEVIKQLTKQGVVVSLGHSVADYATGERALECGASALTHLFSAMNAFTHREPALPGLICSGVQIPSRPGRSKCLLRIVGEKGSGQGNSMALHYGLIADGVHTHDLTLRLAYRLNRNGLCLITDAIAALGEEPGRFSIGGTDIDVLPARDGDSPMMAYKVGTDTLAGAVASIDQCVRRFQKVTNCSVPYVLGAASLHPARCLGIDSVKGKLDVGYDADLVILDDNLLVHETWIAGQLAFKKNNPID